MNTPESLSDGRDPVAFAVEKYLHLVEQDGVHKLSVKKRSTGYRVRFAGLSAECVTLDIAFVRLGAILLDNAIFRDALTKALRGPVAIEEARRNRAGRFGGGVGGPN